MMSWQYSLTLTFVATILPLLLYSAGRWLRSTQRPLNFPPGPPPRLGQGNQHQIPKYLSFLQYDKWAKQYGPIVGFKMGSRNVVLLNDASLVHELIIKRATSFSARPRMYIAQEHVLSDVWYVYSLFMRNDYSTRLRTVTKHMLVGSGLSKLAPMQKAAGTRLAYNLLQSGDNWMQHIGQWALTTPVAMLSGAPIHDIDESWIQDYNISQGLMTELLDPWTSVDMFPMLRWIPSIFSEWKRKAPIARKALLHAYDGLMAQGRKERHGSFQSLIPKLLSQNSDLSTAPEGRFSEQEIKVMMGGMLDAGVGSTLMSFQTILLALAAHPEVQHRAQAEIDNIFGGDKSMPDKINLEKLPYLNACVTEALRWRPLGAYPVGPFGLPRESTVDEEILGYSIPKGTAVLLNQWTIAHDPEFYDNPERYDPERFIKDPVGAKEGVTQVGRKAIYTFGVGRRECVGKEFFFQNVKIAFAQILWAFDIVPIGPLDLDATTGFTEAVVLMPKPFKVKFVPRRVDTAEALLEERQKADGLLSEILA